MQEASAEIMSHYLLDTNALNNLLDYVDASALMPQMRGCIYVTHIQKDEIENTKDFARRASLLECLQEIGPDRWPTETFVLDRSRLGMARLGDNGPYAAILTDLDRRKRKTNNPNDALIGETAELHGAVLVSDDGDFADVMKSRGVRVVGWREFVSEMTTQVAPDTPV